MNRLGWGKERKRIRFRDGLVALFSIREPEKGPGVEFIDPRTFSMGALE